MIRSSNKPSRFGKRLIYKVRHHRGHGIHSPFVFRLVNDVIEEKRPYYCYKDIEIHIKSKAGLKITQKKYHTLAFRLCNFMNPKSILTTGNGIAFTALFASAFNSFCKCNIIEINPSKIQITKDLYSKFRTNVNILDNLKLIENIEFPEAFIINLNGLTKVELKLIETYLKQLNITTKFVFIIGIRENNTNFEFWKSLENLPIRTASLDLFKSGILFFKPELSRYEYQISF